MAVLCFLPSFFFLINGKNLNSLCANGSMNCCVTNCSVIRTHTHTQGSCKLIFLCLFYEWIRLDKQQHQKKKKKSTVTKKVHICKSNLTFLSFHTCLPQNCIFRNQNHQSLEHGIIFRNTANVSPHLWNNSSYQTVQENHRAILHCAPCLLILCSWEQCLPTVN